MYIVTENLIKKVRCLRYILIDKLRSIHIWISKKYFNLGIVHKFRSKWWSAIDNQKPISCIKFYITKHLRLYVSIAVVKLFFFTKIRIRGTSILFVKKYYLICACYLWTWQGLCMKCNFEVQIPSRKHSEIPLNELEVRHWVENGCGNAYRFL